ncbi:hypothetical protein [Aureivirga marina]|uniref:hypothetical protein n=1 Tax=Aureivirga marina TaxID=1182451 RepID=UPI0018CA9DC7|nr:hypothetical protein [Aureivirga marina]
MSYYLQKIKRYKRHFICVDCRKGFKKSNEKDFAEKNGELSLLLNAFYFSKPKKKLSKKEKDALKLKYFERVEDCPQCNQKMKEVSMSFKAPAKNKLKEWKELMKK